MCGFSDVPETVTMELTLAEFAETQAALDHFDSEREALFSRSTVSTAVGKFNAEHDELRDRYGVEALTEVHVRQLREAGTPVFENGTFVPLPEYEPIH